MSTVVTAATAAIDRHHDDGVAAVIEAATAWVHDPLENAGLFSTFALGRWTPTEGLVIANAGHSPVIKVNAGTATRIEATCPPLGVIGGLLPDTQHHQFSPGDVLVVATDGFTEQRNPDGAVFGEDRFDAEVCAASELATADAIGETLVESIRRFAHGADQDDDRTMFILKAHP